MLVDIETQFAVVRRRLRLIMGRVVPVAPGVKVETASLATLVWWRGHLMGTVHQIDKLIERLDGVPRVVPEGPLLTAADDVARIESRP